MHSLFNLCHSLNKNQFHKLFFSIPLLPSVTAHFSSSFQLPVSVQVVSLNVPRRPKSKLSSELKLHIRGLVFAVDKEILTNKSSKVAEILRKSPGQELSLLLGDIPADQETLDLAARFCHGYDLKLSTTNVIGLACLADYLGMTESQCPNNLLQKAKMFIEEHVIPSWNESIKALKNAESILQQVIQSGIIDRCLESLIVKVMDDPRLLGEPMRTFLSDDESDENENVYRPNARRKLFDLEWKSENLTGLSPRIYAPIIQEMIRRRVPQEYIAANVSRYTEKWLFQNGGYMLSIYEKNLRELVEVLEQLLPHQRGILPCTFLFQMLKYAMSLDTNTECKNGLEIRIGRQLDLASVTDLLIPVHGYANDERYDTECVRRILQNFYANYTGPDVSGLYVVAELIEEFLAEISSDVDLKMSTFTALADMSAAASNGTQRYSDGLYRALDIYLDNHRHLTESEREELCGVLDCNNLSAEALEHAATSERLPLRIVVQVLFAGQLKLRDTIAKEVHVSGFKLLEIEAKGEEGARAGGSEEEMKMEMEKMGYKVLELERKCDVMKQEIRQGETKREKQSLWRKMKRKLGCVTGVHDLDCHVNKKKKVQPR